MVRFVLTVYEILNLLPPSSTTGPLWKGRPVYRAFFIALNDLILRVIIIRARRKIKGKSKSKAVPLHAWSGPEDSRKLRFPDFVTTAQDRGKIVSRTYQPPLPQLSFI